ncbi:MAG: hypothetical protein AAF639_08780, partial [Chloroflexota bacterium]
MPDENRRFAEGQRRFVSGGRDSVLKQYEEEDSAEKIAKLIAGYVVQIAQENSVDAKQHLYELLLDDKLIEIVDSVLQQIKLSEVDPCSYLHRFALLTAQKSPDRGPVKFAIALLGMIGDINDRETISLLGRHEEFTLYVAVALEKMLDDPSDDWWGLAQRVDGWGKIHLVRRLVPT